MLDGAKSRLGDETNTLYHPVQSCISTLYPSEQSRVTDDISNSVLCGCSKTTEHLNAENNEKDHV